MSSHRFQEDLSRLSEHYSRLMQQHGDTPPGVQWRDRQSQERRLEILTKVGDLRLAKVLDFGCGAGHLLTYMQRDLGFAGEYVGYDLSARMIATAKNKFPQIRFEQRDILTDGIPEDFDYVLVSGVFNNRVKDGWSLMTNLLSALFQHTRTAIAFNALSTYVDYCEPELFYVSPESVFRFCKEQLSPSVCLRHDYLIKTSVVPFEFSMYVYKTELESRKNLRPEISVSRE